VHPPRLPRQIEGDVLYAAIQSALTTRTRRLWEAVEVPELALTDALLAALRIALVRGQLQRGLEATVAALEAERKGLMTPGERVSRLCLFTNDGSERFYRQVERCLTAHAPRVLGGFLDADGATLGKLLYGRDTAVKLVLAEHKDAVSAILRSLVKPT
jgi:hypothetical protein